MDKAKTIKAHKIYIERYKEETPCQSRGCYGNNKCGHECLDKEKYCTLSDVTLECPCCAIVQTQPENIADVHKDPER